MSVSINIAKQQEKVAQLKAVVSQAVDHSKAIYAGTKMTFEHELQSIVGQVKQVEKIAQQVFAQQVSRLHEKEQVLTSKAHGWFNHARQELETKFPALINIVNQAESLLNTVDQKVQQFVKVNGQSEPVIKDYDSLNANEAIAALQLLPRQELLAMKAYEMNHKNRKTVIEKIEVFLSAKVA